MLFNWAHHTEEYLMAHTLNYRWNWTGYLGSASIRWVIQEKQNRSYISGNILWFHTDVRTVSLQSIKAMVIVACCQCTLVHQIYPSFLKSLVLSLSPSIKCVFQTMILPEGREHSRFRMLVGQIGCNSNVVTMWGVVWNKPNYLASFVVYCCHAALHCCAQNFCVPSHKKHKANIPNPNIFLSVPHCFQPLAIQ